METTQICDAKANVTIKVISLTPRGNLAYINTVFEGKPENPEEFQIIIKLLGHKYELRIDS